MMHIGQKWHCVDPRCRAELVVTESSRLLGVKNPVCACGGPMKRVYEKPTAQRVATSIAEGQGRNPETNRLGVDAHENTRGH